MVGWSVVVGGGGRQGELQRVCLHLLLWAKEGLLCRMELGIEDWVGKLQW